jgi:hypothetical protein
MRQIRCRWPSIAIQTACQELGGRPAGLPPSALSLQPVYKPGSGWHAGFWPACVTAIPLGRRLPGASSNQPGRPDLDTIPKSSRDETRKASHRPYSVLLPVGFAVPPALPQARCALTAPFHPYRPPPARGGAGGLFSVALSLGSHPPDVIRHRLSTEPGLSSPAPSEEGAGAAVRPTDREGMGAAAAAVKGR